MNMLEYVYEIDDLIIKTYILRQDDSEYYLEKFRNYHYSILGDMMIYKLTCRGYISIDEAKKKYNVNCFNLKEKVKKVKVKIRKK